MKNMFVFKKYQCSKFKFATLSKLIDSNFLKFITIIGVVFYTPLLSESVHNFELGIHFSGETISIGYIYQKNKLNHKFNLRSDHQAIHYNDEIQTNDFVFEYHGIFEYAGMFGLNKIIINNLELIFLFGGRYSQYYSCIVRDGFYHSWTNEYGPIIEFGITKYIDNLFLGVKTNLYPVTFDFFGSYYFKSSTHMNNYLILGFMF